MRITRAMLAEMVKACRGSVINIGRPWSTRASVFNQDGGGVDYCSSKAALHALSRATARTWLRKSDASAYITGQTLHVNGGLLMVD